jgi:hypothetical protein
MYQAVAEEPHGKFHSEMGKTRPADWATRPNRRVVRRGGLPPGPWPQSPRASGPPDLGSTGTDLFLATRQAGAAGEVIGMQTGCKAARPG